MENKPKISVIVPVYNAEKYLDRCVESIINQTFKDFELILVDDGSTDDSGVLSDKLATKDKRIKVFHKENGGVSSARNIGLDNALGKYVAFCDPDDFIHPQMYEILYKFAKDNDAECVVCNFESFSDFNNIKVQDITLENKYECFSGKQAYEYIRLSDKRNMLGCVWNKLFLKSSIHNLRFNTSLSYGEDLCFVLTFLSTIESMIVLNDVFLYYYFIRSDSVMRTLDSKKYLELYFALIKTYEIAERNMGLEINSYFGRERILVDTFLNVDGNDYIKLKSIAKKNIIKVLLAKTIGWKEKLVYILRLF
ncbi:glycosyltransferase [uncultured Eubacterium sp.]|uniref:glycosyltransferase n=1 Tax=uncultured Eubacterium sp. TaxID=165185 RepID=UPI00258A5E1F|nr:glycosyltransferase [uncultured Eubacterium sp.]